MKSKISLGAAQFGMDYGVTNLLGKVGVSEIKKILDFAKKNRIESIDTAASYGDSEANLGLVNASGFKITSKLPEIDLTNKTQITADINQIINRSLANLKRDSLDSLLLHRPNQLLHENGQIVWDFLEEQKNIGVIKKIGFSIYSPAEIDSLINSFKPDIVQCPYNFFDRRMCETGCFEKLNELEIDIQARSIFLQGLLLLNHDNLPENFSRWKKLWVDYDLWLKSNNLDKMELLLNFVLSDNRINSVVIGVTSFKQLEEIILKSNNLFEIPENKFSVTDIDLIDPSRWHDS